MSGGNMGQQPWDRGGYQPTSGGQTPPPGGYQPDPTMGPAGGSGGGGDYAVPIMVGLGVVVILVVAILGVLLMGSDEDDGTETTSNTDPTTTVSQPTDTTAPGGGGAPPETGSGTEDLPAPDVSVEASPPQMYDGISDMEYPVGLDETVPILGEVTIDLPEGGYVDAAVQLDEGEVYVLASANDRIGAKFQVYGPDGSVIAEWTDDGEPEVVQGWEFSQEDTLTESGTYVFRVISLNGSTGQFPLRFFR